MHKFKNLKGKLASVAIKLDMEKAYDRLECDFIHNCFHELGFHRTWNKWIMECVSSISNSIIVNDESNGFFTTSRGIRQGDPLLPYIFIICMEVLNSTLIKQAMMPKSGIGVNISPRTISIPCILFTDDCLIFCKVKPTICHKLKSIVDNFCSVSGQLVNFEKSVRTFSRNATNHQEGQIAGIFDIQGRESLGKYLGCPIF